MTSEQRCRKSDCPLGEQPPPLTIVLCSVGGGRSAGGRDCRLTRAPDPGSQRRLDRSPLLVLEMSFLPTVPPMGATFKLR